MSGARLTSHGSRRSVLQERRRGGWLLGLAAALAVLLTGGASGVLARGTKLAGRVDCDAPPARLVGNPV